MSRTVQIIGRCDRCNVDLDVSSFDGQPAIEQMEFDGQRWTVDLCQKCADEIDAFLEFRRNCPSRMVTEAEIAQNERRMRKGRQKALNGRFAEFKCLHKDCGRSFASQQGLTHHTTVTHGKGRAKSEAKGEAKDYACRWCDVTMPRAQSIASHERGKHPTEYRKAKAKK